MILGKEIGMCSGNGGLVVSMMHIDADEQNNSSQDAMVHEKEEPIVMEKALKRSSSSDSTGSTDVMNDDSGGGTAPCSEEFSTDDETNETFSLYHGVRHPSLVLKRVKQRLSRSKSESSFLDCSHHNHLSKNWIEGLDLVEDNEEPPRSLHTGTGTVDAEEDSLTDDHKNADCQQCCHAVPLERPSLYSPVVFLQRSTLTRRPSCLKRNDTTTSSRSCGSNASSVHFGTIQIREYQRTLSDNPAVTEGPPIGLGWDYDPREIILPVDEYEDYRPARRQKEEFLIPSRVREEMLLREWGLTLRDIRQASQETKVIRKRRERAQHTNKALERVCEVLESLKKKWHRVKARITKKKEQVLLWKVKGTSNKNNGLAQKKVMTS